MKIDKSIEALNSFAKIIVKAGFSVNDFILSTKSIQIRKQLSAEYTKLLKPDLSPGKRENTLECIRILKNKL